eukprot:725928-Ditylum_brightwellii.AAC.1
MGICEPTHGHLLQVSKQVALQFEAVFTIESNRECRNTLQTVWGIQKIFNTVTTAIHYITEAVAPPTVDAYHVTIPDDLAQTVKS